MMDIVLKILSKQVTNCLIVIGFVLLAQPWSRSSFDKNGTTTN